MAKKESPLKKTVDGLFHNKNKWNQITSKEKEQSFFMINQLMSKKSPQSSEFLNKKGLNKEIGTELWSIFTQNVKSTPEWFWKRPKKSN